MVTASMNSRRRSAMAFPATEFTAADDGLMGTRLHKNRQLFCLQSCPEHVRNVSCLSYAGIGAPTKRYRCPSVAAGSKTNPTRLRAVPPSASCARPIRAGDAGRMAFQPALGSHGQRRILPPGPATIASGGARHGRRCWTAIRPRSGRSRQGWKPSVKTGKARLDAQHNSPARGAGPRAGAQFVWSICYPIVYPLATLNA